MSCGFLCVQPNAYKGGVKMTTTWILYVIIGLAASAYGFYLVRKEKRQ
jgi:uncharacterized membrane protein YuzA (DUF378 family)